MIDHHFHLLHCRNAYATLTVIAFSCWMAALLPAQEQKPEQPLTDAKSGQVQKVVSGYYPMVNEGQTKVLWQKRLPDESQLTLSFQRVKTVPLPEVEAQSGRRGEPIPPDATLIYSLEFQRKAVEKSRVLWKQQIPFYHAFHYNFLDVDFDGNRLTMVVETDGIVNMTYVFSMPVKENTPLRWENDNQLKVLSHPPIASKKPSPRDAHLKEVAIVNGPSGHKQILVTWDNGGTARWELNNEALKLVQPYTAPKPPSAAEMKARRRLKDQTEWMDEYRDRREIFGLTKERATAAVRARSGIKDWEPLKEAWDTPDLKSKRYWLTPTPAPTPTSAPASAVPASPALASPAP